ncbi:MAG: hypothetical protein ACE5I3_13095 [Phycisphaerae bacterium]
MKTVGLSRWVDTVFYGVSAFIGVATWVGVQHVSGQSEAWDSPYYWRFGFPSMLAAAGLCGMIRPRHAWRWGLIIVVPQPLVLFIFTAPGPGPNMWPVGMCFFGGFALLCAGAGALGGAIVPRAKRRIPPGHCQKCGYDLTGNVSGKCPECGEAI